MSANESNDKLNHLNWIKWNMKLIASTNGNFTRFLSEKKVIVNRLEDLERNREIMLCGNVIMNSGKYDVYKWSLTFKTRLPLKVYFGIKEKSSKLKHKNRFFLRNDGFAYCKELSYVKRTDDFTFAKNIRFNFIYYSKKQKLRISWNKSNNVGYLCCQNTIFSNIGDKHFVPFIAFQEIVNCSVTLSNCWKYQTK